MEILIIVALFVALAVLAPRFGVDSRDRLPAREEDLAALGLAWDARPDGARPARAGGGGRPHDRQQLLRLQILANVFVSQRPPACMHFARQNALERAPLRLEGLRFLHAQGS